MRPSLYLFRSKWVMEMDKLLRIETITQSVSNHSSQLYYTTFLVFSKINITKFQKINNSKKKIKEIGLTQIKMV